MSDLSNMLSLRRRGISGAKKAAGPDDEKPGMMDRISDMIPPPPAPEGGSGAGATGGEDDWED